MQPVYYYEYKVVIKYNFASEEVTINQGVRQGYNLSPTLFNINIDYFSKMEEQNTPIYRRLDDKYTRYVKKREFLKDFVYSSTSMILPTKYYKLDIINLYQRILQSPKSLGR